MQCFCRVINVEIFPDAYSERAISNRRIYLNDLGVVCVSQSYPGMKTLEVKNLLPISILLLAIFLANAYAKTTVEPVAGQNFSNSAR